MRTNRISALLMAGCLAAGLSVPSFAAEKERQPKVKPYPHYWMNIATSNQSIPGMSEEMAGMAAMFSGKGAAFGPRRELQLQLESPRPMPAKPEALHNIPPGQNMGASLPLVTPPKSEKPEYTPAERGMPEKYEKPKARMLIYWGCGDSVGKGQPRVIDTAKMSPVELGKAFAGRSATHQTPPHPHNGWVYGDWPNQDDRKDIPRDSSLVGDHQIQGNYVTDIRFSLDKKRDYMAPVEFSSMETRPSGAVQVDWKPVPTAIGYFATVMAHNEKSGETILWSASEVPETGFALMDYLTPGDVGRFIKEKVVMEPSRASCTIPPVFKDAPGAMLQFIAYGEELNLIHPPKPKDPKQVWQPQWSVKARLKSTGMTTLMAGEDGSGKKAKRPARSKQSERKSSDDEENRPNDTDRESGTSKGGVGDRLRGLFGF